MVLEFKTARNKTNGDRRYLAIDTEAGIYSRFCPYMVTPGVEIKAADYKEMLEKVTRLGFKEADRVY